MTGTPQTPADPNLAVRRMFDGISSRYDLLNRLLSASLDRSWRRRAVELLPRSGLVLDLCAGTADLSIALHRAAGAELGIVSADFSKPMLDIARRKLRAAGIRPMTARADARALPWRAGTFDAVTIAFGIRNVHPPESGLREIARVLRPGGRLLVLEFFGPRSGPLTAMFRFYFRRILPRLGGAISGDRGAYAYLPDSVSRFVTRAHFVELLASCGLQEEERIDLTGGIATAILARRREARPARRTPAA